MRLFLLAFFVCAFSDACHAATIYIETTAKDNVGQALVYRLRNKIAASPLHKLVYTQKEAGFVIHLTTLNHDERSVQTVYSAVLTMPSLNGEESETYITSQTGYCGSDTIDKCSEGILSGFDEPMSEIERMVSETVKKR